MTALNAEAGDRLWELSTGERRLHSSPTVVDGMLYFGSRDGSLYAVADSVGGSSVGSRVVLGTLGHHNSWDNAVEGGDADAEIEGTREPETETRTDVTTGTTVENGTIRPSGDGSESEGMAGFGIESAFVGAVAYLLGRRETA